MKTAEELASNLQRDMAAHAPDGHVAMTTEFRLYRDHIAEIQLDARISALEEAANDLEGNIGKTFGECHASILSLATKLKEGTK